MKGKNTRPGLRIISLHRLLAATLSFQHASDNTKGLSQSYRYLLQHPIFCSWNTIRLHSSKHGALQYFLEAKHH